MMLGRVFAKIVRQANANAIGSRSAWRAVNALASVSVSDNEELPLLCDLARKENSDGVLKLTWENGQKTSFSSVFLRDCCRCSECFDENARERNLDTVESVPLDILPERTVINSDHVRVVWPDGHESTYSHRFLWTGQNTSEKCHRDREDYDMCYTKPTPWTRSDIEGKIPSFDFASVLSDDWSKYNWFRNLSEYGVTLLKDAGREEDALYRLKTLFGGYFKSTHYGVTFKVSVKPEPNSIAYTPKEVLPHVDLPHYEYIPGVQALHCIDQFTGRGANTVLIDGFNVVKKLKELDWKSWETLRRYKVRYRDLGADYFGEFASYYDRPVIEEKDGAVCGFAYSNLQRDYQLQGEAEEIHDFYKSYYKLTRLIKDPENVLTFKLNEGEIIVFNNRRLLHGRTVMSGNQGSKPRLLHGCYFDWDGLYSYMRLVKRRLDNA